jgi:hypothetical protein
MPTIPITNPVFGGIADSLYLGAENSLHKIVGFDLHSEPGLIKVQQKLKKDSGNVIDEFVKTILPCTNGEVYFFSATSGKIWGKTSAGVYSLRYTCPTDGDGAYCLGGAEFNGYVYWANPVSLNRIRIADALAATWIAAANFANLQVDTITHPFKILNECLYIGGDGKVSSISIDSGGTHVFELDDLVTNFGEVHCFGNVDTNLLVGYYMGAYGSKQARLINWNTWSNGYTDDKNCPETGVNCLIPTETYGLAHCGARGNLYAYDGSKFKIKKRIPGIWGLTDQTTVHNNAAVNDGGIARFGLSAISGAPADCGIYGFGSHSISYNPILTFDFAISTGNMASVEIGAIALEGTQMYVSWKDSTDPLNIQYGVDVIDVANKYDGAYFDTRIINIERGKAKDFDFGVYYRTLPANCDIEIYASVNGVAYGSTPLLSVNDTVNNCKSVKTRICKANTIQFRVKARTSGNTAPEIESAEISYGE